MAYVMLYGVGWTQRWRIPDGSVAFVRAEIDRVGRNETGHLPVVDPSSEEDIVLVIAWQHVAAAVVLGGEGGDDTDASETLGQYR
ncbi:hypothetical protein KM427_18420 [Nocardioides sp. LMS-CY]|uniref:hypothetical protein n=1 Tax=Nocardioides sp. (strain LMS-CY) TaxID=2840457 RepID=UPI001C002EBB|nr:hypothetical protein [Nocardioides sp. LMS-CY]QWF20918.1 hypothetical protein KM427_18420 [Nocardioides sp. LMS-CY]